MFTFPAMHFSEPDPTCTLVDNINGTGSLTTYAFAGVNFGPASPTRLIVVCMGGYRDKGGTIVSATIGGVAATIHFNSSLGNGSLAMISALVPTGTSGAINITWSIQQAAMTIDVYAIDNIKSTTPAFTLTDTASPLSQNITFAPKTVVIAQVKSYTTGSFTWSGSAGLIEQDDSTYGVCTHSSAMKVMPAAGTGLEVAVTYSGTLNGPGLHIIGFS